VSRWQVTNPPTWSLPLRFWPRKSGRASILWMLTVDALLIWYSKVEVGVPVGCFVLSMNLIGGLTWNGSIVLDTAGKLGKILIGMNRVLGEIPVTVKLRTGVKDGKNTAHKLMPRLGAEWGVGCLTVNSLLLLSSKNVKI